MTEEHRRVDRIGRVTIATFSRSELAGVRNWWQQLIRNHPGLTPTQALTRFPQGEQRERYSLGIHALNVITGSGKTLADVEGISISQVGNDVSTRRTVIKPPQPGTPYRP